MSPDAHSYRPHLTRTEFTKIPRLTGKSHLQIIATTPIRPPAPFNTRQQAQMATSADPQTHLLVFPFPAQGHLIALLDLAHHLSLRLPHLSLTVVVTPAVLPLLHHFLAATPSASPLVLPLPFHPLLAPSVEHVRDLPSPSLIDALMRALSALSPDLLSWARSCALPPSAILSDFFLGWTHHLAADLAIPRIVFYSIGAFGVSVIDYVWRQMPSGSPVVLASLPSAPSFPYPHLPAIYRRYKTGDPDWEFTRDCFLANNAAWGAVINTFDVLEGDFLAHLKQCHGHDRVWAVGPIRPTGNPRTRGGDSAVPAEEVVAWLDSCPPRSVVYICFGSQYEATAAQIGTITAALEASGVRFVLAVGAGAPLEGFRGERGTVIRGWAPQVAILGHDAVAAFVTHCGWNSVLEAAAAGVPLLAWPMGAEQFVNARLLERVGVAVKVGNGGDESVPAAEDLAKAMKEFVSERGSPSEMRARAAELRRRVAEALAEGGSSHTGFEELVKHLIQMHVRDDYATDRSATVGTNC